MRQMKDSGIEWIGEIPESWSVHPAKYAFTEIRDKNTDGKIQVALQFKNGTIIRKNNFEVDSDDYVADTILNYTIVEPDVIMINGLNLNYDLKSLRVAIVREKGVITSAYLALMPDKTKLYPDFANYLFKGYETKMAFHNMGAGIRLTLGFREFKKQPVLFPETYEEQHLISAHLDRQCSLIDSVIEKTKASIEEYKKLRQAVITQAVTKGVRGDRAMKDSGIEWIGEIPESWDIVATKRLFQIISGATPKSENPDFFDGEIAWITPADYKTDDVYVSGGRRNITDLGLKSCNTSLIPSESIIFSKRAPIGSVAINKVKLCTNQGCLACVPQIELSIKFYYYFMAVYSEQYNLLGSGTTFKEISVTCFSDFKLTFPPLPEQQEIAAYLDQKCAEIDSLITQKEQFITELDSYKKSLIYEYVTGKKEVPQV